MNRILAIALCFLVIFSSEALAEKVTVYFSGTVIREAFTDSDLTCEEWGQFAGHKEILCDLGINFGDPVTGSYTYDTTDNTIPHTENFISRGPDSMIFFSSDPIRLEINEQSVPIQSSEIVQNTIAAVTFPFPIPPEPSVETVPGNLFEIGNVSNKVLQDDPNFLDTVVPFILSVWDPEMKSKNKLPTFPDRLPALEASFPPWHDYENGIQVQYPRIQLGHGEVMISLKSLFSELKTINPSRETGIKRNLLVESNEEFIVNTNGTALTEEFFDKNLTPVNGAVTDGVSKILIALQSSTDVTFSIISDENLPENSNARDGELSRVDGSNLGTTVGVSPQKVFDKNGVEHSIAFAIYHAPDSYRKDLEELPVKDSGEVFLSRKINIRAWGRVPTLPGGNELPQLNEFLLYENDLQLTLEPPPLMLIHGIWDDSSNETWGTLDNYLSGPGGGIGIKTYRVDYSANDGNAKRFSRTQLFEENVGVSALSKAIRHVRAGYEESLGLVMTQADVLGHSMGGLVARTYEKYDHFYSDGNYNKYDYFYRKENYNKGEINKLIAVGTPHFGSAFAGILEESSCLKTRAQQVLKVKTRLGAVTDLAPESGALLLINQQPSDLPIHTVVGKANISQKAFLSTFYGIMGATCLDLIPPQSVLYPYGSDLVVGARSQKLNNSSDQTPWLTTLDNAVHSKSFDVNDSIDYMIPELDHSGLRAAIPKLLNSRGSFAEIDQIIEGGNS